MTEPIACTLSDGERADRGGEWSELRRTGLIEARVESRVFTTRWRPEVRGRLVALVEAERVCCSFIDFAELEERESSLVLRAVFPPGAEVIGERLFGLSARA